MKAICENEGVKVQDVSACYLCGTEGHILYTGLRDRLFGAPGKWNLQQCPNPTCGLIWLDPMPTEADLQKVYATYYTHQQSPNNVGNLLTWRRMLKKFRTGRKLAYRLILRFTSLRQARINLATMYLAHHKPGRLLEIGCGSGVFLDRMRSRGWDVQGVEIDPNAVKAAETFGVPIYVGTVQEAGYPSAYFDAITMNHVIEHVHNPIALLKECYRVLKPGGGPLVVVTPNVSSRGHAQFGSDWMGLDPPRHLHLFSQSTLATSTNSAGFNRIETWTTPANAEVMALASADIRTSGKHIMGSVPSLSRELKSEWLQLQALIYYRKDSNSGDEVILRAYK
jgi:2-polyprenyl-3-methyl-5-hydroxy-6-metoxy-1,4-benzoquinol methylase